MTAKDVLEDVLDPTQYISNIEKGVNDLETFKNQNPALAQSLKGLDDVRNNVHSVKATLAANKQQSEEAKKAADIKAKEELRNKAIADRNKNLGPGNIKKLTPEIKGEILPKTTPPNVGPAKQ